MLDDLDYRLIALLRANSRTPVAVLARELGVNRSTVTSRIDRLVDNGVIEGFTIRVSGDLEHDSVQGVMLVATGRQPTVEGLGLEVATPDEARETRFGFIITKAVGGAVVRNTVRRRLKAVCAEALPDVREGADVVIRALPSSAGASFAELRAEVRRCLERRSVLTAGRREASR